MFVHVSVKLVEFMTKFFTLAGKVSQVGYISYFGIMGQYDLTVDLKINVGLCDLYFMVQ